MYIRRKVFSLLQDESGETRYFSTTDYELEFDSPRVSLFSKDDDDEDDKKKSKKKKLESVESHKGIKRAILSAAITGGGSLAGGYLAKEEADKADREGLSDEEILRRARKKGLKMGAITGATVGSLGLLSGARGAAAPVALGALGALGGRNAAGVNTKDRLRKRSGSV